MSNEEILKQTNNGKKFDICLMNPPYGKNLFYTKFLNKVTNISTTLISIQPAKFITTTRPSSKSSIIKKCGSLFDNINEVEIYDANKDFNTGLTDTFSIIKTGKKYNGKIKFIVYDKETYVDNIKDCTYLGNSKLINSILEKVNKKSKFVVQKLVNIYSNNGAYLRVSNKLTYHPDKKYSNNGAYLRVSNKLTYNPDINFSNDTDTFFDVKHKNHLGEDWQIVYRYVAAFVHKRDSDIISKEYINEKYTYICYDKKSTYEDNYNVLNNFKEFILHTKLGHVLCMILFMDENGHNYRNVFPFIEFDKMPDDDYNNNIFNLDKEEIDFIDICHRKFERKSKDNVLYG